MARHKDRGELYDGVVKKVPRFASKPKIRRKQWAVFLLLRGGDRWNYGVYEGIVEAWATAKALQGTSANGRSWIEHIDQPAHT